jgi:hypothetical protein
MAKGGRLPVFERLDSTIRDTNEVDFAYIGSTVRSCTAKERIVVCPNLDHGALHAGDSWMTGSLHRHTVLGSPKRSRRRIRGPEPRRPQRQTRRKTLAWGSAGHTLAPRPLRAMCTHLLRRSRTPRFG